jgi:O-antigen/teichoic acid export membrane protein
MKIEAVLSLWLVGGCVNVIVGFIWIRQAVKGDRELYRQRASVPGFIDMLKESVPMGLANCMAIIRGSSDVLIIGWLLGASEAGLYGPLKRVSKLVVFLLGAIAKTLSPIVATLYAEERIVELEAVCRKSANIASIVGIPVALFFFVWGDWFLCLVFGNEYRNMGLLLSILILGPVSRALLGSPGIVLQMTGHEVAVMKVNFIISFLTILLMAVFVIPFGLYAIAVVSSALLFIQFLLLSSLVYRKLEFRTFVSVGPIIRS